MSNVINLRQAPLDAALDAVREFKPKTWCIVALTNDGGSFGVWGPPDGFDIINMLGMLEYAKAQILPAGGK